jgi:hypothetical protein
MDQRLMVVEAVWCEPVSIRISLFYRELTGKFYDFGPIPLKTPRILQQEQQIAIKFPEKDNREFL